MAKTISHLSVSLGLKSRAFHRGMNKAQGRLRGFSAAAKRYGAAAAATAGVATAAIVRQSFVQIDALAKTSDKLGIATEKLAGLRHAAELTGVGASKLEMGLQRMTRRVSEAAQGTGEAQAAIAELGLDAAKLAKLSPDEQFYAIADAMEDVANQGDRVRLGFKLFDSEGVALINTLKGGSAELRRMQKEAERLGLAVDRDAAKKIEAANDAIHRMKGAFRGLGNTLAITFAPVVEWIANSLTWVVSQVNAAKDALVDLVNNLPIFQGVSGLGPGGRSGRGGNSAALAAVGGAAAAKAPSFQTGQTTAAATAGSREAYHAAMRNSNNLQMFRQMLRAQNQAARSLAAIQQNTAKTADNDIQAANLGG